MTSDVDDQVTWPTRCPECGTELESRVVDSIVTNDWNEGSPVAVMAEDFCPNPDCPSHAAGVSTTADPDGAQP